VTRRVLRQRAALVLLTLAIAPGVASAQEQEPEQLPPGTIVYGPLTLTPSLVIKDIGIDDNVFNEAVDPKSDFTLTLTPRASVALRARRVRLTYVSAVDYVYYDTYVSERGTNVTSEVRVAADLGRLRPYASLAGTNTRTRLNTEVDARARHHDQTYSAGLALRVASRTKLLLNARRGTIEYEPAETFRGVVLGESFNSRADRIEGGLGFELTPITTFDVLAQREQQRFDMSPSRNANSWRVWPTLTFNPAGLLTGNASFGYRHFDAVDPTVPDYSGAVASVTMGATLYGRHQLQAAYLRDVQYSYDPSTPYYVGNGGRITWTSLVAGPFDVQGTIGRTLMYYRGEGAGAGTDYSTTYGGGTGYRFPGHARLGVNAEWVARDSNRSPDREYRNRRIFASLTWGST
jgi:putative beta-barrel porin BBP2